MSLFRRRQQTAEQQLLANFLKLESERLAHRSDLESKREELEVRKLEIELEHLEARTKSRIELEAAAQELRMKRREAGRKGMQKRRANDRARAENECVLCADPNFKRPTPQMIDIHRLHAGPLAEPVMQ